MSVANGILSGLVIDTKLYNAIKMIIGYMNCCSEYNVQIKEINYSHMRLYLYRGLK